MKIEPDKTTTALILTGGGYSLTIAPEAEAQKQKLLAKSSAVLAVANNDESADAQYHIRQLAQMRILVDKSRKEIKEPVLRIGKQIDAAAKAFLDEIEADEARLRLLVSDHALEQAKAVAEAEAEEIRLTEAARAAKASVEAARIAAESGKLRDLFAVKTAEAARAEALAARHDAAEATFQTRIAEGVRFTWDFEVLDRRILHEKTDGLTEVSVKRAAVLEWLKEIEEAGMNVEAWTSTCGLRAFKKPVVSSR